MQIQVITNEASFFQQVFAECRQLHPQVSIQHCSEEAWTCQQPRIHEPRNVYIGQGKALGIGQAAKNSENAFAVIGTVCQNNVLGGSAPPANKATFPTDAAARK